MKTYSVFIQLMFFVFILLFSFSASAVSPSDYGLKEGDLISAIFSDDPDVYIVNEHGYKRLFLNPEIFKFYIHLGGFTNVKLVTPEIRDSFPTSGLFRNCEKKDLKVYGFESDNEDKGKLRWIDTPGDQAVKDDPDFFKKVFCINDKEFKWYPRGQELKSVKEVPQYHRIVIPAIPAIPAVPASPSHPFAPTTSISQPLIPSITPKPASGSFAPTLTPIPAVPAISAQPAVPSVTASQSNIPTPTLTTTPTPTPTLTATPLPASNLSATAPSVSPIGYWKFDGNGSNEISGSPNAIVMGNATLKTSGGKFGGYLYIPTGTDSAKIPYSNIFDLPDNFTIEFWFRQRSNQSFNQNLIYKGTPINNYNFNISRWLWNQYNFGPVIAGHTTANTGYWTQPSNPNQLAHNEWHHVVFTKSPIYHAYYLDSNLIGSKNVTSTSEYGGPAKTPAVDIIIGDTAVDTDFDNLRIYNIALNQSEVLYNWQNVPNVSTSPISTPTPTPILTLTPTPITTSSSTPSSTASTSASPTPTPTPTPTPAPSLTVTITSVTPDSPVAPNSKLISSINIQWTTTASNLNYKKTWRKFGNGDWMLVGIGQGNYFWDLNIGAGTYSYKVNACSSGSYIQSSGGSYIQPSDCGPDSNIMTTTLTMGSGSDTTPPSKPTGLTVWAQDSRNFLSWTAPTDDVGVVGYNIYRNGLYLKSACCIPSEDDFLFGSSSPFSYTVAAYDAAGNVSEQSSPVIFTHTFSGTNGGANNFAIISRNLTLGSTGDDVKQLQALLVNEVNYPASLITGYFGRITQDAVRKLQEKYGVKPAYGYFGEITRKMMLRALISNQ